VRVYEREGHGIWIDYRDEAGRRIRQPLKHDDRERAKLKADEVAAEFRKSEARPLNTVTLRSLFEMYEREVTPQKGKTAQAHDRRAMPLFIRAFGGNRKPESLSRRDWDSYIQRRRRGEIAPAGKERATVRTRAIEQDCNLLLAILNWGTRAGDGRGGYLVDRNPLSGLEVPREESPKRAILSVEQFEAIRNAARTHSPRMECFVLLAWFTGHRAASIRQLRWSDVDFEKGTIHWRGELDKIEYDHKNPLHPEALAALKQERNRSSAIGDAWIFPAARKPMRALSGDAVFNLWKRFAKVAGIKSGERYGWHSSRRAFANTLRNVPLRDLKDLGGWKTERTVVSVYQQPSHDAQRVALTSLPFSSERAQGTGT
jgi:integrase